MNLDDYDADALRDGFYIRTEPLIGFAKETTLDAAKLTAWLPISNELLYPDGYYTNGPVTRPSRYRRIRRRISIRVWSIRRGLASRLAGYDVTEYDPW